MSKEGVTALDFSTANANLLAVSYILSLSFYHITHSNSLFADFGVKTVFIVYVYLTFLPLLFS